MTQPTAEQLRLARECAVTAAHSARFDDEILSFWVTAWSDRAKGIFEEGATQSALLAIQATEARMSAAVEAERARCSKLAADYAASMKPTVILGDDDSIYLTDHEQGQKDAAKRLSIMIHETAIRSQSNG